MLFDLWHSRRGRRLRGERGAASLFEAVTVTSMLGLVLSTVFAVVYAMWGRVSVIEARQAANDEVRSGVIQLDREIRSGNVFTDPASFAGDAKYTQLVIYTQNNAGSFSIPSRCAHWRITTDAELQWRWWDPTWDPDLDDVPDQTVTGWTTIAKGVVNLDPNGDGSTADKIPAFERVSDDNYGDRLISIDLRVQLEGSSAKPIPIELSVTGRNTEYGYPTNICSHQPAEGVSFP